MQLHVVRDIKELDKLAPEWNQLLDSSASHVPFLRHEYLSTWWHTLGGGEWDHGELYVVTVRHDDGKLCGIAPLFLTENLDRQAALMLLGSIEISDYLDFLAHPDDLPAFVSALLDHLNGANTPSWEALDLYNILEDSPTLQILKEAANQRGLHFTQEKLQHCPYIPLPGDWETYLAGIDKKQRHEIRRKIRRAESFDLPVRWYIVEDRDSLEGEIEASIGLMAQDPGKQDFLTDSMRSHLRSALRAAFDAGWLQLAFLDAAGEKAAGYINFDFGDHIWIYNSGFDIKYSNLSPGWVLLGYLLQWANDNKRQAFDFMRGDEDYKYRFGGIDRFVVRTKLSR